MGRLVPEASAASASVSTPAGRPLAFDPVAAGAGDFARSGAAAALGADADDDAAAPVPELFAPDACAPEL